jgi:hypothetical protein
MLEHLQGHGWLNSKFRYPDPFEVRYLPIGQLKAPLTTSDMRAAVPALDFTMELGNNGRRL